MTAVDEAASPLDGDRDGRVHGEWPSSSRAGAARAVFHRPVRGRTRRWQAPGAVVRQPKHHYPTLTPKGVAEYSQWREPGIEVQGAKGVRSRRGNAL